MTNLHRKATCTLLAAALTALAWRTAHAETPLPVPSDPRAKYTVLDVNPLGNDKVEVVTKRIGPSGTSHSKRLIDCAVWTFKYTGDADTYEGMQKPLPDSPMGPLTDQSISWYVAKHACSAAGYH